MRRTLALLMAGTILGACSGSGSSTTTAATTTSAATSIPPTTSATTLPATTTTTTPAIGTDPLTDRAIGGEEVGLMPLVELPSGWGGWNLVSTAAESNGDLVRIRIQDPRDAAADLVDFARAGGARTSFAPGTEVPPAVDTWVEIFDNDAGASGYLTDFVRDAVKGLETGAVSERTVVASDSFDVDDLEAEAIGLVLYETEVGSDMIAAVETVAAFRLGRVLGFVSIQRTDERDDRAAAARIAGLLADRIRDVLEGRIVVPEPPLPPESRLQAYRWRYEETLLQTIEEFETEASAGSTGTVVSPDLVDCTATTFLTPQRYILAGARAWLIGTGGAATPIADPSADLFATDLAYCPPWPAFTSGLGIELGHGIEDELDGRAAVRYDLDLADLAAVGALPDGLGLVIVETAAVWADAEESWLLGFDMAIAGTGDDFAVLLGPESAADPNGLVRVTLSYRMERINDETLTVIPPG